MRRKNYTKPTYMPYTYKYPRPAVTTDCVIFTFHEELLKVLLVRRGVEPFKGMWALPGGFLKMDESAEEGAYRELKEETGVTGCTIKQFHTFSRPNRDPRERVVTIAFYALMKWQKAEGADDAEFADWIAVNMLPPLAFDHEEIIELALETIRRDIFFEPVGFDLLNDIFSMPEVQKVYEAILGKEFDRRNFAKKMKHLDILEEVNHNDDKVLPLPFLNKPSAAPTTAPPIAYQQNEINYMMDCELESLSPDIKRSGRRKNLWFRLNRKRYDELKDEDQFEF